MEGEADCLLAAGSLLVLQGDLDEARSLAAKAQLMLSEEPRPMQHTRHHLQANSVPSSCGCALCLSRRVMPQAKARHFGCSPRSMQSRSSIKQPSGT